MYFLCTLIVIVLEFVDYKEGMPAGRKKKMSWEREICETATCRSSHTLNFQVHSKERNTDCVSFEI